MTSTDAILYAPRMAARLYVADLGLPAARQAQANTTDTFRLDIRPLKARWESNSYRNADALELTASFDEAGIDPRYLRSAEVYFWLGDGGDQFVQDDSTLRFIGIVRDVAREFDTTSKVVTIRALDYTTMFLESSPFPQQYLPKYTDTLRSAYQKVCRWTGHFNFDTDPPSLISSVSDADSSEGAFDGQPRIPLVAQGTIDLDKPIGQSVAPRIAALANMQHQTGTDSWAVWVTVCESLGLITYIKGSQCIVTAATEYFTATDPPLLVYGQNVLTLTERRDLGQVSGKHVCVRSYDGLSGTMREAFYPDPHSPIATRVRKKKVQPSAKKASKAVITQDYEVIDLQIPCTDQNTLNQIAEMIWMARVRQELTGTLTTREMFVQTVSQAASQSDKESAPNFDLLALQAGDNIQISIGADALDNIQSLPTTSARLGALVARGYSHDLAQFIVDNLSSLTGPAALPPQFLVHSCECTYDSQQNTYDFKAEFVNTLGLDGSAVVNTPGITPVDGTPTISVPVTEIVSDPSNSPVITFDNPFEISDATIQTTNVTQQVAFQTVNNTSLVFQT